MNFADIMESQMDVWLFERNAGCVRFFNPNKNNDDWIAIVNMLLLMQSAV